ncbi:unnamed protein product [Rotaria sp. Silwood2]|nr:unnamed protein product [Rotaria sp. Silwood2]CAF2687231.1 unnamed protein product [Rotaria sp. Silwood2]CAF3081135.1 unnamed protein product [Rotaria sp. Silwood2]CAF3926870.1 unnamed protein product [Rotaria sp. Silwood2]CAF3970983.1 unnamed protein product [Rotaria sp. Silwood2]
MTSSSSTYLLSDPTTSLIGSKSILIKQSSPTMFHSVQHQFQHPLHRPPLPLHSHQQIVKSIPANDTFHSLTVPNINNGNSLLTTNNNNGSSVLTTNNNDEISGSLNGHSLSQSMESINNIGLQDDEVR